MGDNLKYCGSHKIHASWTIGALIAIITVLALVGLLPWQTKGDATEFKNDIVKRMERIENRLDAILSELRRP